MLKSPLHQGLYSVSRGLRAWLKFLTPLRRLATSFSKSPLHKGFVVSFERFASVFQIFQSLRTGSLLSKCPLHEILQSLSRGLPLVSNF